MGSKKRRKARGPEGVETRAVRPPAVDATSGTRERQSLKEQLSAVHHQLQEKTQELERLNADMANLKEVASRFAAIVDCSADAVFSKDLDGTISTWNQGAERLFGYTAEEAIGESIRLTIPEDRVAEWGGIMVRLARGEHVEQMETERLRKDGRRVPVVVTYSPIRNTTDKVVGVSAIVRDVSEQQRSQQALRDSEERLRRMMENAHVGIAFGDGQGRIIEANRTMLELVGWSEYDLRAGRLNCRTLCRAGDAEQDRWAMNQLATVGRVGPAEKALIRTDGVEVPVLISAFRIGENREENVTFVVDLSSQKEAEERLRGNEERLQAILDTAMDGIITIDHNGIIRSANAAAERMFGYSAVEMIGQSVNMLMSSPHREMHDRYLARYLETGERHIIGTGREVEARRKDGSIFPADLAVSEIKHLKLFTGIHRDLTERRQLEREVVEATSMEQRRIGQDLHDTVAQELTALTILGRDVAETLRSDPANATRLVARMNQGLQRSQQDLRTVLNGLLPVAVDSEGLMAALADLAARTHQEGKVASVFDCREPVSVTDNLTATQLYFIAREAVHNAVKHARARKVRIALEADGELILRVEDDGAGMPIASPQSHGQGLRIMRHRAALIGARLTIAPAAPKGTLVVCALSRKQP